MSTVQVGDLPQLTIDNNVNIEPSSYQIQASGIANSAPGFVRLPPVASAAFIRVNFIVNKVQVARGFLRSQVHCRRYPFG